MVAKLSHKRCIKAPGGRSLLLDARKTRYFSGPTRGPRSICSDKVRSRGGEPAQRVYSLCSPSTARSGKRAARGSRGPLRHIEKLSAERYAAVQITLAVNIVTAVVGSDDASTLVRMIKNAKAIAQSRSSQPLLCPGLWSGRLRREAL